MMFILLIEQKQCDNMENGLLLYVQQYMCTTEITFRNTIPIQSAPHSHISATYTGRQSRVQVLHYGATEAND